MAQPATGNPPPNSKKTSLDGPALKDMFGTGMAWLEVQEDYVNSLNVFPVPDGDTGTNLLLTMRSALAEASQLPACGASVMAQALAQGALMGARGNAGVIFSQILRGFHQGVGNRRTLEGEDLPEAFRRAAEAAYRAVAQPVEGTILTVIREVSAAVQGGGGGAPRPAYAVLELAAVTAQEWVARTPELMPLLKENGVVDSGAQGLAFILGGMSRYAHGDQRVPAAIPASQASHATFHEQPQFEGQRYGFCAEFFIQDSSADVETVRAEFVRNAASVMVAGDRSLIKVHLHTLEPESYFSRARALGTLGATKVEDMDAQHREWQRKRSAAAVKGKTSVVAVATGAGLEELFRSSGAAEIVRGGQTINPSSKDILDAINAAPTPDVIVLPNNRNIVLAANQAKEMAHGKRVLVVPTRDIPQGMSAMIGFNYEATADENAVAMVKALEEVKTGELSRAVRAARLDGRAVRKDDAVGLVDGKLVAADPDMDKALTQLIDMLGVERGATLTLYHGGGVTAKEAARVKALLQGLYPQAEVQVYAGGQPNYAYLVSVE